MTASPMNFSRLPPNDSMASFAAPWYACSVSRTSSGSPSWERPVKPTKSAKSTDMTLRSCLDSPVSGAPQARQNRARSGFSSPQRPQRISPESSVQQGSLPRAPPAGPSQDLTVPAHEGRASRGLKYLRRRRFLPNEFRSTEDRQDGDRGCEVPRNLCSAWTRGRRRHPEFFALSLTLLRCPPELV